ncbi:MAG: ABC transporter ATP-binding protein [Patescibacteria group bacterium]
MSTKEKNTSQKTDFVSFIKTYWYFIGNNKIVLLIMLVLFAIAEGLTIVYFQFISKLVDELVNKNSNNNILYYASALGGLVIASGWLRIYSKERISLIGLKSESEAKKNGMQKLLEFPLSWHQKENSGNKIERLNTGTSHIRRFTQGVNNQVLSALFNLIGIIFVYATLNWKYIAFGLGYAIVSYVFISYFEKIKSKYRKELMKLKEISAGIQYETASNILTAKATDTVSKINSRVIASEDSMMIIKEKIRRTISNSWYINHLLNGLGIMLYVYFVINDYQNGLMNVGLVSIMLVYFRMLRSSIHDLIGSIDAIEEDKEAIMRMMPIFEEKPEIYFGHNKFPNSWDSIKIAKASFSYPSNDKTTSVLDKFDLEIIKNQKIGIVGHSGSGKSTLAKLLIGLYKLESGEFKIGKEDFYNIDHQEITKNISIVLQEVELFNMSFKDNITLLKEFDETKFSKAIDIAQLNPIVDSLPQGIETKVGEKGYKLSGGQRQRIGIARAIYSDSPIVIFDEATSALDTNTEKLIQESIDSQVNNKTLIFIAHRLSTLRNMDRIIVFENGSIVEDDKIEVLLDNPNSKFYKLWNSQIEKKKI